MEDFETEIDEGNINIPKIMSMSKKFLKDKTKNFSLLRNNSFNVKNKDICNFITDNYLKADDKLNYTAKINKYKSNFRSEETNSTSMGSNNEKIKKVTFSTVEIIRVENYKRYNKLNTIKKNENSSEKICILF